MLTKKTVQLLGLTILFLSTVFLTLVIVVVSSFPSEKEIKNCITTEMYQVYLCPSSGKYTKLSDISPYLLKSIVLTEDSTFWSHQGFNFEELEKSLKKNLEKGKYLRGGSTISQQLAKNIFLTKEKTLIRKIKEAFITMQIERTISKKEILEKYVNVVQFGKNIYGVKSAAQFYFKKSPRDLDIVESAFLAFLLPSPEKYSKSFYKKELTPFARNRLSQIIESLHQYQKINFEEYTGALVKLDSFLQDHNEELPEGLDSIDENAEDESLSDELL